MTRKTALLSLLTLLFMVTPSESVWCYVCHSLQDSGCGDDFWVSDVNFRQSCDASSCVKWRGRRSYSEGVNRVEVQRGCVPFRSDGCYTEIKNGIEMEACACKTNFCNGGNSIMPSFVPYLSFVICFLYLVLSRQHLL